ncbi:MAG: AsnC family transcriptional regulator [Rhodospirillaceae bacterium]|nr:MAG: AsnC family transcriptional regulator [Rhodospirillaceae bacterium]
MHDTKPEDLDRRLVRILQEGLPLVPRPYHAVAEGIGVAPEEVLVRLQDMCRRGVIRRIGAIPNHYALGYGANGMTVWDIPEDRIAVLGEHVGALPFVSHCYQRPRRPLWPYTLFAMVHARDRVTMDQKVNTLATLIGSAARDHQVLVSTRILKKTGLRFAG